MRRGKVRIVEITAWAAGAMDFGIRYELYKYKTGEWDSGFLGHVRATDELSAFTAFKRRMATQGFDISDEE